MSSLPLNRWKSRRILKDSRTWKARRTRLAGNWAPLIDEITATYLGWKYPSADDSNPSSHHASEYSFDIDVIDIYTLHTSLHVCRPADSKSPAIDLVRHGYLPAVPNSPTLAVSLKTLELFRRIRLRKASFSVEAFAKVICDLYSVSAPLKPRYQIVLTLLCKVPFRRWYRAVLADAFDLYLSILRTIDTQVSEALGRNAPDWRALNSCPPCGYEVRMVFSQPLGC
jgi:hypothetical protein